MTFLFKGSGVGKDVKNVEQRTTKSKTQEPRPYVAGTCHRKAAPNQECFSRSGQREEPGRGVLVLVSVFTLLFHK